MLPPPPHFQPHRSHSLRLPVEQEQHPLAYSQVPDAGAGPLFPFLSSQYPFLLPFGLSALAFLFSALCYLFFSIETLTEEERMKAMAMRARMKAVLFSSSHPQKGFSGILRKNRSQQDMEERLLVDFHNHSSPRYLFRDKDFLLVMLLFGCVSFMQMACDTVIPIAMVAPGRLGGLGLGREELGVVSGVASPFQLSVGGDVCEDSP